ncbi:LysR family transcriptional regulator [Gluconacetobacter azotocaptans]|uniref:LysR family transcriptional regulator n=1 Tax=Gluconacetobacter azotocaptans TaxID=142834 RepID=A0A7W4JU23_9PROT|nr:LysR family transcriptional regulator [Gluconacetobacter azotocaptans]MBB2190790.1 LysR family transcriptional regulator [Gluconacetobacter azotocaptans]MBM9400764.1 LysR family transcriptional regulator [Gluconacetobacter azotocaptans]GBQ30791.1 transcriptional regulator [Gluconacetobacter azotocaptans DSM 13594]
MNIRDLEHFIAVSECGSFSKASAQLGRPQPALSRHIRDLETDLRVQLLYRNGRGVVLTEAGKQLRLLGTKIIRQIRETQEQIRHYSSDRLGSAAIGMPASVSTILLSPLARSLREAYRHADLRFIDGCNGDLFQALNNGALDVALVYDAQVCANPNMETVLSQPLYLIELANPADGPADIHGTIDASGLAERPLVLPGRRHGLRQIVESWAGRNGINLNVQFNCDTYASMLQIVSSGMAATVLPASAVKREIMSAHYRARLITRPTLCRSIALVTSPNRPVNVTIIDHIKKNIDSLADDFSWPHVRETAPLRPFLPKRVTMPVAAMHV